MMNRNPQFFRIAAFCLGLFFLHVPFSAGQDFNAPPDVKNAAAPDFLDPIDPFRIKVNVNEIRLDVVVVDGRGRPITDLIAADFEIYQDKLPQEVSSSVYINDQTQSAASPAASRKDAPNLPPHSIPGETLKKEEVRRTIVFVVDTLSMNFEDMHFAKMALRRFVDRQMQPGDLVSIIRTSYGNGASDMFLSDKRLLNARIDGLYVELAMADRIYGSQEIALSYGIRALKDMPGRKIIFLMTSEPTIENPFDNFTTPTEDGGSVLTKNSERPAINNFQLYGARFDWLANEALRSGVVVHLLDTTGLCVPFFDKSCEQRLKKKMEHPLNPLPAKTGGILVTDSNFFLDGIGNDANNMIAGYYLVSYTPPPDTFDGDVYRRVSVKVKRQGASVYTREGFYSRTLNEKDSAESTADPLYNAIFLPFRNNSLNVNMIAGYIKKPEFSLTDRRITSVGGRVASTIDTTPDYVINSWIYLDLKDIAIVETEDGGARIDLEVMNLTSDINGKNPDVYSKKFPIVFEPGKKSENIAWLQQHGLRFSMSLPVKKPGPYTVNIAIRDIGSGKIGSAYQFVQIPDLKKKGMEMSSIFMLTSADNLDWLHSEVIKELAQKAFFQTTQASEVRSPAFRTYTSGDDLKTLTMLYNADSKAITRSEIEAQSILYKDGVEFSRGESVPVTPGKGEKSDSISLLRRLTIGQDMPPGEYLLQILATDKKNSEKRDGESAVSEANMKEGLFARIAHGYLGTDKDYSKERGVASQTLSFTVEEDAP